MSKDIRSIFGVANPEDAIAQFFYPSPELDNLILNGYQSNLRLLKKYIFERKPPYIENLIRKKNKQQPILSLITSLYKGDEYIAGFLENTCNQVGFCNYELIILNCNSPGNEEPVILKYCEQYENITYIKLDSDPGLYQAWNLGIEIAKGDYVSNANLDDRRSLSYYALMVNWMIENNLDVGSSLFWTCTKLPDISMDEDAIIWYKEYYNVSYFDFFKVNSESGLPQDQCVLGPMPIWKKSLHKSHGFFNEREYGPSADYAMWCKLLMNGCKFGFFRVPLVYYLKAQNSYARRVNTLKYNNAIISDLLKVKI